jgi:hypothetical protein
MKIFPSLSMVIRILIWECFPTPIDTCILLQWNCNIMGFGEMGVDKKLFGRERERMRE